MPPDEPAEQAATFSAAGLPADEETRSTDGLAGPGVAPGDVPLWDFPALAGRLVEISGGRALAPATRHAATNIWDIDDSRRDGSAALTLVASVVWNAQHLGEPVAWINARPSSFFPPDLDEAGIDLGALVVVRLSGGPSAARAADKLLRSGAFGLVVLDVGVATIPSPLMSRLLGLAQKHHAAIVFLTEGTSDTSLAPIVSLRVTASRKRAAAGRFTCRIEARKDKRRAPGWIHEETFRGPPGLR